MERPDERRVGLALKVLIFRSAEQQWVAQVLEKDLTAHGPTEYAALAAVQLALQVHVNYDTRHRREPLSRLKRAPEAYWVAYTHAQPLPLPEEPFGPAEIHPAVINQPVSLSS